MRIEHIGKYFGVTRAETFEQAIYSLNHYMFADVKWERSRNQF